MPLGQVLTRVEATDDDSEAGVTFSLVTEESSERAGEYFSVSPGGQIILQVRSYVYESLSLVPCTEI